MTDDLANEFAQLEARFEKSITGLEEKVAELQEELQEERQRRRSAERALAEVERDTNEGIDLTRDLVWSLEDVVYGDVGTTKADFLVREEGHVFDRLADVEKRVEEVARGEVDASELVSQSQRTNVDDLIPLHQLYISATNLNPNEHDLTSNQEIAARLFPFIAQYATPKGDEKHLKSSKVKDVIEREIASPELAKRLDVERPNRNTIRRVMEFIGQFGKDFFEFAPASSGPRNNRTNLVIVDREAWIEYADRLSEARNSSDDDTTTAGVDIGGHARTDGGDVTSS